jgi:hypothetical protein
VVSLRSFVSNATNAGSETMTRIFCRRRVGTRTRKESRGYVEGDVRYVVTTLDASPLEAMNQSVESLIYVPRFVRRAESANITCFRSTGERGPMGREQVVCAVSRQAYYCLSISHFHHLHSCTFVIDYVYS